jgi:hypothetical protein
MKHPSVFLLVGDDDEPMALMVTGFLLKCKPFRARNASIRFKR